MQPVAWSIFGASIGLTVAYLVRKHDERILKRESCTHNFRIVEFYGYKTRVCVECGFQEPVKGKKDE